MRAIGGNRESGAPPGRGTFLLWFGLLGGGFAWTLHLLVLYGLAQSVCVAAPEPSATGGLTGLLLVLSLVSVVLAVAATLAGLSSWRRWRGSGEPAWAGYAGLLGLLLSGLFTVVILAQTLPVVMIPNCGLPS